MKKVKLEHYEYQNSKIPNLEVIVDDEGIIVFLTLLFSIHLKKTNETYSINRREERGGYATYLESSQISESTVTTYMSCLFRFCKYVNRNHWEHNRPPVHCLHELASKDINSYLNESLPLDLGEESLQLHLSALTAFFNFLTFLSIKEPIKLYLSLNARRLARERHVKKVKVNYISSSERFELLKLCDSHRDRLLMKMGSEVGLRASENQGLLLSKNGEEKGYLKDLFKRLDSKDFQHQNEFKYLLSGKYTKNGVSRNIFFSRTLLTEMRRYFDGERELLLVDMKDKRVDSEHLFINIKGKNKGHCISPRLPSDRFSFYVGKIAQLSDNTSYHDLRHTFATELYHQELLDENGAETRSESAALVVVAERLGHALTKEGRPSSVTVRYIRLRNTMLIAEGLA